MDISLPIVVSEAYMDNNPLIRVIVKERRRITGGVVVYVVAAPNAEQWPWTVTDFTCNEQRLTYC